MTQRVFCDRSRIESFQRCGRLRFLEYHEGGMGITSRSKPLPLAVGGSVHAGLAVLLQRGQAAWLRASEHEPQVWMDVENAAVKATLADFAQYQRALEVDTIEVIEQSAAAGDVGSLVREFGEEIAKGVEEKIRRGRTEFEDYLYKEQAALVEGMVRAYARRRLRALLEQYEVLEVEREGQWLLSEWMDKWTGRATQAGAEESLRQLWFMSRPDALLRERESNQLYILSFKTAAKWDYRKEKDAQHDMQGLSEGVEVEKRLARWWSSIRSRVAGAVDIEAENGGPLSKPMLKLLMESPAPPRILGIRYEYMLKGDRWKDKELSERLGIESRTQRSVLVSAYRNLGMASGDEQWNCSWDYLKEGGETSKLYWKNWRSAPVWQAMTMKQWIDKLDTTVETTGEEGKPIGWSSEAQATGFLTEHPLDAIFLPAIICYRNDDDLRDWVESTEAQEVRVAEAVASVRAAKDEGEKRSLLNQLFPMTRSACTYPTACQFERVCYGGEEIRANPLGSGLYKIRTANHPQENASEG